MQPSRGEGAAGQDGLGTILVQVWIDEHHLVRKLQMQMNMSVAGHALSISTFGISVGTPQSAPRGSTLDV